MNMTENTEQFECFSAFFSLALQPLAITLDESKQKLFFQFYMDLIEKNKHMNLTAIVEMKEVIVKHFVDSLSVVQAIPDIQFEAYRILDLGTGAGFPGIPLAIAWPQLKLTLVDCLNKRIHFIEEECRKLGLHNIIALHARAEDLAGKQEHREQYDLILSRAVSNLSTLSEYCLPFIHNGGTFIPYKSGKVEEEIQKAGNALGLLGAGEISTLYFRLPVTGDERCLLSIKKVRETPRRFPRKAGTPSANPLQ